MKVVGEYEMPHSIVVDDRLTTGCGCSEIPYRQCGLIRASICSCGCEGVFTG